MFSLTVAPAPELGTLTRSLGTGARGSVQPSSATRWSLLLGPGVTSRQDDIEGTVTSQALGLLKNVSTTGNQLSVD